MQEGTPIIIKRKKAHGHAHHGGAWKVAYADFVTAMMAFFMVMWIMGMDQPTREVIAGYFKDPVGFAKTSPRAKVNLTKVSGPMKSEPGQQSTTKSQKAETQAVQDMAKKLEQAIKKDAALKKLEQNNAIKIRTTPEGLEIQLVENETNSELFFKLGSAEVRPEARVVLGKLAPVLASIKRKMMVDGHTDARPLNRPNYDNFDLSHDRANAVRRLLVADGCGAGQFLGVRAFAANQLRKPEDPMHFSNRRVTILIPFAYQPPGFDGLPADVSRESIEGVFKMPTVDTEKTDIKP